MTRNEIKSSFIINNDIVVLRCYCKKTNANRIACFVIAHKFGGLHTIDKN